MSKYDCELNLEDRNSLSVLVGKVKPNSLVLEFGPANGRMTKYMKERLNCKVYAVEIDEDAAKDAAQYTEKIIVDSIENYRWQEEFKDLQFDYIIFADVLEHLYYPEKVLKSVRDFLREDGSILVSIPNIAHNAIIINLLKNEFNYHPTGLLDDTHIRFFTKKTFDELIKKTGYFTSYETAIFLNPENTEFRNSYDELKPEISEYLQSLSCGEIYQLIYEFKKNQIDKVIDFSDNYIVYNKNFIQLFIEKENGLSEENSIKYPVLQTTEIQRFEFDLKDFGNIKNLRLDPLNDSCVVNISKIYLVLEDDLQLDLKANIQANACSHHGDSYFFESLDPQVYFENVDFESLSIKKFVVELVYNHFAKDAMYICANQMVIDKNHIIETKEQNIQTLNVELETKEQELSQAKQELENIKTELANIYISKSWKLTRPLRRFMRIVKK